MSGQEFNFFNVIRQALKPTRLIVMIEKLLLRLKGSHRANPVYLKWLQDNSIELDSFVGNVDRALWSESLQVAKKIKADAAQYLANINYDLGGGGCYPLLYFLIRKTRPEVTIETGVAAGFSTYAILLAIEKNNVGKLYSSDFPYFRIKNPESYIGCIVPDRLRKDNWKLYIEGDKNNLPLIFPEIDKIDLLHYDSDKSYDGRKWVLDSLDEHISDSSIVIMDDVQDNTFFYDYINRRNIRDWKIFSFEGKFLGVINGFLG